MRHVHCCTLLCAQGVGCAASACARRAALATACCCMAVRTTACKTGLVIATLVRCGGGRSKVYKGKPCAADSCGRHRFRTARFAAAHRFRSLRLVFGPRHAAASVPHREVLSILRFVVGYVAALLNALARPRLAKQRSQRARTSCDSRRGRTMPTCARKCAPGIGRADLAAASLARQVRR